MGTSHDLTSSPETAYGGYVSIAPVPDAGPRRTGNPFGIIGAAIIGTAVGFVGSIFGPFYTLAAGITVAIVGGMASGVSRRSIWPKIVLAIGIALIVGAGVYLLLGLIMPQGASSGSGSGCAPGGSC